MNSAAQQLARIRWDNATAQEIEENSQRLATGRKKRLSKRARSDIARMAAVERWRQYRAKKRS